MLNSIACRMRVNYISILVAASETHQKAVLSALWLKKSCAVRSFSLERNRKYFDKWIAQSEQFSSSLSSNEALQERKLIKAWSCRMDSIDVFGWEWKLLGLMKENRKACRNNPWIDRKATTLNFKVDSLLATQLMVRHLSVNQFVDLFVDILACLLINHPGHNQVVSPRNDLWAIAAVIMLQSGVSVS